MRKRIGLFALVVALVVVGCTEPSSGPACDEAACRTECVTRGYGAGTCVAGLCTCGDDGDAGADADATADTPTDTAADGHADADADAAPDADTGPDADLGCVDLDLGSTLGSDLASAPAGGTNDEVRCGSRPDMLLAWRAPGDGRFRFTISCLQDTDVALAIVGGGCGGPILACQDYECFCSDFRSECCCWAGCALRREFEWGLVGGQQVVIAIDETCTLSIADVGLDEMGELCFDGIDNDRDGSTDCFDRGCSEACSESGIECSDGIDNDHDGATDCADAECSFECREVCPDGIDNDLDGLTDCDDDDCTGTPEVGHVSGLGCEDGLDNDCDGLTDCADLDCDFEAYPGCWEDCENGIDDDGDGRTDCDDGFCSIFPPCV